MVVIGCLLWAVIALAYAALLAGIGGTVVAIELALRRAARLRISLRIAQVVLTTALIAGFLAPLFFGLLYVPHHFTFRWQHDTAGTWTKPRLIEDQSLAWSVSYGSALVLALPSALLAASLLWASSRPKRAGPIPSPAGPWGRVDAT